MLTKIAEDCSPLFKSVPTQLAVDTLDGPSERKYLCALLIFSQRVELPSHTHYEVWQENHSVSFFRMSHEPKLPTSLLTSID
jgi:hypothetical protein